MARWRLMTGHYLMVPGTEWEYSEQIVGQKKRVRKLFQVPALLDPNDPSDWNYPDGIIVTDVENPAFPNDILFTNADGSRGEPTQDMVPIDAEATAITRKLEPKWKHAVESLPATGGDFSTSLISLFERQMKAIEQKAQAPAAMSVGNIDKKEFDELKAQVAALMKRNAELEAVAPLPSANLQAPARRRA